MYSTNNHPIIPSPPTTIRDVTDATNVDTFIANISTEDRNINKYPHASSFTVELPQEYTNVTAINLHDSFIPDVTIDFTLEKNNVDLVFRFIDIADIPQTHTEIIIYVAIKQHIANNNYFRIRISDGSYTQEQLMIEVQNRMNQIITDFILNYYSEQTPYTYTWGDYIYSETTQTTTDGHRLMLHPAYATYQEAVDACNAIAGEILPLINMNDINTFAHTYGHASMPPPLLAIPTVSSMTDLAQNVETYDNIQQAITDTYYDYVKTLLDAQGGYNSFKLFYNKPQKKCVIGNNISSFEISTDFDNYYSENALNVANNRHGDVSSCTSTCKNTSTHTNYINWGLPTYMGFSGNETIKTYTDTLPTFYYYNKDTEPNMYNPFQHATTTGFATSPIYILTPCNQLNIKRDVYYYMEIDGINMVDELLPHKNNAYTVTNGNTNGIINSFFAKRLIFTLPRGSKYQEGPGEAKTFTPPLRRMNKVSIRIRYHDGSEPNFGNTPFELTLKIVCQKNQLNRSSNPGFAAPA